MRNTMRVIRWNRIALIKGFSAGDQGVGVFQRQGLRDGGGEAGNAVPEITALPQYPPHADDRRASKQPQPLQPWRLAGLGFLECKPGRRDTGIPLSRAFSAPGGGVKRSRQRAIAGNTAA